MSNLPYYNVSLIEAIYNQNSNWLTSLLQQAQTEEAKAQALFAFAVGAGAVATKIRALIEQSAKGEDGAAVLQAVDEAIREVASDE